METSKEIVNTNGTVAIYVNVAFHQTSVEKEAANQVVEQIVPEDVEAVGNAL